MEFKYKCEFCGKEVSMGTKEIVEFIGRNYGTMPIENITGFFDYPQGNLCMDCAREEGLIDD